MDNSTGVLRSLHGCTKPAAFNQAHHFTVFAPRAGSPCCGWGWRPARPSASQTTACLGVRSAGPPPVTAAAGRLPDGPTACLSACLSSHCSRRWNLPQRPLSPALVPCSRAPGSRVRGRPAAHAPGREPAGGPSGHRMPRLACLPYSLPYFLFIPCQDIDYSLQVYGCRPGEYLE